MPIGRTTNAKHMYHAVKPAVMAYTPEDEVKFRLEGYTETYIPQEYPKVLPGGKTARNAAEEKAMLEVKA